MLFKFLSEDTFRSIFYSVTLRKLAGGRKAIWIVKTKKKMQEEKKKERKKERKKDRKNRDRKQKSENLRQMQSALCQ